VSFPWHNLPRVFSLTEVKIIGSIMTQSNGFNLDNLDSIDSEQPTFKVAVILDAEGEDKSGFIIQGKNSPEYQAEARSIRIDSLQKSSKRKTALDASTAEGAGVVANLIDSNDCRLAMSVVTGWFGFVDGTGVDAVFDKATVKKMFAKFPTWREKVSSALEVDANFIKG
jgi:hypothetical protein